MGLSQGGLLARAIVEKCPTNKPVRNMITFGTPHQGVSALPHCFNGFICDMVNAVVEQFVYFPIVQKYFGPAGYWRSADDMATFLAYSIFLPYLNNEV